MTVASVLKRLCARLRHRGFEEAQLHAHLFRHDYITRKALDGGNPSVLKRWVGHRTFAMTDRYFGIAESKLAAVRPKHSVLEDIVPLPQKRRGGPAKAPETGRTAKRPSWMGMCALLRGAWSAETSSWQLAG